MARKGDPQEQAPRPKVATNPAPNSVADARSRKRLKVWGSTVLLFAFATQQFLVVHYIAKLDGHFRGYQAYSNAYNSSLAYQNLYFSHAIATTKADGGILRKGAGDNIAGFSAAILASDLPTSEKTRKIKVLFDAAGKVNDLESFNEYIKLLNLEETDFVKNTQDDYVRIDQLKTITTWVYLGIYFIGSLMLLRAIKYE